MEKGKDKKSKIMLLYADGIPYGTYKHKTDKWFLMIHYLRKFRLMEAYFSSVAAPEMEGVFAAPGLITPNFRGLNFPKIKKIPQKLISKRRVLWWCKHTVPYKAYHLYEKGSLTTKKSIERWTYSTYDELYKEKDELKRDTKIPYIFWFLL